MTTPTAAQLPPPAAGHALASDPRAGRAVLAARAQQLGPPTGLTPEDVALCRAFEDTRPAATRRAYALGRRRFEEWCAASGIPFAFPAHAVTPEAVAAFVVAMAAEGLKPASVGNYVAGIAAMHRDLDLPSPADARVVREALGAVRRAKGTAQRQAAPLRRATVAATLRAMGDGLTELRDAALIAMASDTGLRADELVNLDVGDVAQEDGAASLTVRRSKTDQEGRGRTVALPLDTLGRVRRWIEAAGLDREPPESTPLFHSLGRGSRAGALARLSRRDVARIYARRTGRNVSAHSPRVGTAQDLRAAGVPTGGIAQAMGWKSDAMPARYTAHLDAQDSALMALARREGRA